MKNNALKTRICSRCDAVHENLHWRMDRGKHKELEGRQDVQRELCPGCERVRRRHIDGIVTLKGKFLLEHKNEVLNLVTRIARARRQIAVDARIINLTDRRDEVEIVTTERHLAEQIGKGVEKAFQGDLTLTWLKKEEFARVVWRRD